MSRDRHPLRSLVFTLAVTTVAGGLILGASHPAFTDDTELLRKGAADPYLFILMDSSGSMNLGLGDVWVPGGGDNPSSRLYLAKRALYEVFSPVSNVYYGFASFNQDKLSARAKHWIYYNDTALPAANAWPIAFPVADTDGLTDLIDTNTIDTNGDGVADTKDGIPDTRISKIDGDVLTVGPFFPVSTGIVTLGTAGTCASPLDLGTATGRQKAQTFALDINSATPSILWVKAGNKAYRLTVTKHASNTASYGQDRLKVTLTLAESNNQCNSFIGTDKTLDLTLRADPYLNETFVVDSLASGNGNNAVETLPKLWDWTDVVQNTDYVSDHPFTGMGWEGNYDSNWDGSLSSISGATSDDRFCSGPGNSGTCVNRKPILQTSLSSLVVAPGQTARVLDRGDMLPLDWTNSNRDDFLARLSPTTGDYGMATYFADTANADGVLALRNNGTIPLLAVGSSPLNKAILDFRCYYLGKEGNNNNKCPNTTFYNYGWDTVACKNDLSYGCRRPYLIVISDGEENANGESPTADVASMNSHAGVQTWVLNLGSAGNCQGNGSLNSLTQAGKGQCITVSDPTQLKTELQNILGIIEQRARSFASAAVPSVQVSVQDKVFVTNFTPIKNSAYWDGHAHSFLKPIPDENGDGKPDFDLACSASRDFKCHLWDSGQAILAQAPNAAAVTAGNLQLGLGQSERRVVYARLPNPADPATDTWTETMRLFDVTSPATSQAIRYDLWRAMGIIPADVADGTLLPTEELDDETIANGTIKRTLVKKTATLDDLSNITYVLGDIFHSNPIVVGSPTNIRFFADDVAGYRDFTKKHQNRRKMLVFGSNEGEVHAFEAGRYFESGTDSITNRTLRQEFDNGSGKELFAYVPRTVMQRMKQSALGSNHRFTVDGSVSVADVYIDPKVDAGTPNAAERQWRTVMIGGLREGGSGYFGLDITQPDILTTNGQGAKVPDYRGSYVPSCMTNYSIADCGPVPFPSVLWELTDTVRNVSNVPVVLDEDSNGEPDLGYTWSVPNIGRVRLCPDSTCTTTTYKDVAIFGGGMDPDQKTDPLDTEARGNWLYIVDIETGATIYKRKLEGPAPSEPAAVDTDQDGFLDRIYIGTLAGRLYRVDLTADPATTKFPVLTDTSVRDKDGTLYTVKRIPSTAWQPRAIFNTNFDGSTPLAAPSPGRGIYYRPSVLFVAKLGLYALAFGTGDREDLWSTYASFPRFYVFIDDTDLLPSASLPLTESNFQMIDITSTASTTQDYLLAPGISAGHRGWFLKFNDNDRLITDPFSLSGITIFSTYLPKVTVSDSGSGGTVTIACGTKGTSSDTNNTCAKRGNSRNFVMNTTNGNSYLVSATGTPARYQELDFFVTNPFAEQAPSRNKNPVTDTNNDGKPDDALTVNQQKVMDSLKSLFPSNCKFGNYRIDIKTITDETQVELIAPIPVCIIEKNWKEF